MKANIGDVDRILRVLIAILILALNLTNIVSGVFGIFFLVLATYYAITAYIRFSPVYFLLGLNKNKKE
ncbi:MAG: DUF2892 domain-containing protein [Flavobacteriales bacterium]|nr:DUF2892 domain-containing protein [Crocinitomicaceae bacterium]NBX79237.1 DUF2892 domain-containing protein [Flavobacteriales bacterium]NCA19549.1 DUF2892 domain-containing protein [Crocinitomicaceae bacterium]